MKKKFFSLNLLLPEGIVFSLPNGLWAFSYAMLIAGIWSGRKSWLRTFWMASILVLVLGVFILLALGSGILILPATNINRSCSEISGHIKNKIWYDRYE